MCKESENLKIGAAKEWYVWRWCILLNTQYFDKLYNLLEIFLNTKFWTKCACNGVVGTLQPYIFHHIFVHFYIFRFDLLLVVDSFLVLFAQLKQQKHNCISEKKRNENQYIYFNIKWKTTNESYVFTLKNEVNTLVWLNKFANGGK